MGQYGRSTDARGQKRELANGRRETALDEIFAVRLEPPLDAAYLGSSNLRSIAMFQ